MTDEAHPGHEPAGHGFDRPYWEQHWRQAHGAGERAAVPANPYVVTETAHLAPGTALDAGCGEGAEATWLAAQGWQVTAADISAAALATAAERADQADEGRLAGRITWVEADLTTWEPGRTYDLVASSYAHPAMPQLAFYDRVAGWVAPGGTLLVVGHRHGPDHGADDGADHGADHGPGHGAGHGQPPDEATVTLASVTARLDPDTWEVVTAAEHVRTVTAPGGSPVPLHDVVVRARRRRDREGALPTDGE